MKRYVKSATEDDINFNLEELNSVEFHIYYKNKYLYCCSFSDYNVDAFNRNMQNDGFADSVRELCQHYNCEDKFRESPITAFIMSLYLAYTEQEFDIKIFDLCVIISYAESEFEQYLQDVNEAKINNVLSQGHFVKISNLAPGSLVKDVDTDNVFIIGDIRKIKMNYELYDLAGNYVDTYQSSDQLLQIPNEFANYFKL